MNKLLVSVAVMASALSLPTAATAQQRPTILVVDTQNILRTCTACAAARSQLQQKESTLRTRAQQLRQQLETEGKSIQDAINRLGDKQPDTALKSRVTAFQQKQQQANQELENSQTTLQSTAAHVEQQVGSRLVQIVEQVRARRGAMVAVSKETTLANDNSIDVTSEVLSALNQQLPSVSVTPLPQQQQQQQQPQPQGR
jgi:Skp family chaperone for outer membrane proteins